ncbi:Ig-like domain-containing protein [Crocosphaera sp. UHCC 0190]|uniref:Ig-like domain-containing protein n=1 Tax=Crocosphaera sp. UHCC 0190 TaxID=3110246 RepID=UPI002B1E94A5|nr:Ig-like domain-containing protein [Crocosphaera sp. UHCC 0190]MEA5510633.1 Ig-like domain-containing protein [Crocosphaera sp. UHCC 0190]
MENKPNKKAWHQKLKQFDWIVLGCIIVLSLLLGSLLVRGEQVPLQVSYFSWEGKKVGVQDRTFNLKFNRPVNQDSVEKNLTIDPPLPGRITWQGKTLIYTLNDPPIYGTNYQIKLQNAQRSYDENTIEPFVSLFTTRDRVLAYIGIEKEERGRLILYNITDINQPKKTILTPRDLVVTNFKIYPNSEQIIFSAFEPSLRTQGITKQELYAVTTGFNISPSINPSQRAGRLKRILDANDYQNLSFDLSKNGKTIIVWRINNKNQADSSLWIIPEEEKPRSLGIPGSNFVISPDGKRLAVAQQGGIRIVPLGSDAGSSQILSNYEKTLGFSQNGEKLLLVKDNVDYTRSLVLINKDGEKQELLRTPYPIIDCEFEPREKQNIYCLKTDLIQGENGQYHEEPFLSVVNLKTKTDLPLLALPNYRDVVLSMSPDGVALLFDQVVTTVPQSEYDLLTSEKQAIADGQLWLLPLPELEGAKKSIKIQPQELTTGFKPQWLP